MGNFHCKFFFGLFFVFSVCNAHQIFEVLTVFCETVWIDKTLLSSFATSAMFVFPLTGQATWPFINNGPCGFFNWLLLCLSTLNVLFLATQTAVPCSILLFFALGATAVSTQVAQRTGTGTLYNPSLQTKWNYTALTWAPLDTQRLNEGGEKGGGCPQFTFRFRYTPYN